MDHLDDLIVEVMRCPEKAATLPLAAALPLLATVGAACEILRARVIGLQASPAKGPDRILDDDVTVITTKHLAALWRMPEAKIRDLCRTGRLPAKKLGSKEWLISVAALREWMPKAMLAREVNLGLSSSYDLRRAPKTPQAARPYSVEVRRPAGHPQGLARSDGGGEARHERLDQAPAGPARRTRAARGRGAGAEGASEVHASPKAMR